MEELMDPEEGKENQPENEDSQKKSSIFLTITGAAIASIMAAGGGWFVGGILAPTVIEMQETVQKNNDEENIIPTAGEAGPNLIRLQPVTTNLSFPSNTWIRLEISLVVKEEPTVEMAELIHQDMIEYLRTLSLQQVQGARGFRHLRDDLRERAILRSKGNVENLLIRAFLIE